MVLNEKHPLTPRETLCGIGDTLRVTLPVFQGTFDTNPAASKEVEMSPYTLTQTVEIDMSAVPKLTPEEEASLHAAFSKIVEAETFRVLTGCYPPGYDRRTGMPGAYHPDAKPSPYGVIINLDWVTT